MAELILPRDLTAERLRELLDYDPATGVFRRRVSTSNRIKVGDISGTQNGKGYLCIRVGVRNTKPTGLRGFTLTEGGLPIK